VLIFEDAILYQLLSFIGSDNVTDEATDAIQGNVQPLLCCQVVLCPKNAMPVTEVPLCIWVLQFHPAKVHVNVTQWFIGAAHYVRESYVRDLHPDPQHQGADTLKDFFLQSSLVFCCVPHTAKFVQQFIAHYVFVENAKAKMCQHRQCGSVDICAWFLGASCCELVHHRSAVRLLSVKYGKLLFVEPHPSFLCVGEPPSQNGSCVTTSKPKIDQTVKCPEVIFWIGRCDYANVLHSSAEMILQAGETVLTQDRSVVQHADRHGASS